MDGSPGRRRAQILDLLEGYEEETGGGGGGGKGFKKKLLQTVC